MKKSEIIEKIKDEMVCANACPEYHKSDYDIEKCDCYKRDAIESISNSKGYAYVVERKEKDGSLSCRYVGDCGSGTMGVNVLWEQAYKFYDKKSAEAFCEHVSESQVESAFGRFEFEVTEHEEV